MSEVEQLAQEHFNTFKTRLCEILSEIEEEHKSAFMQGYAKGETDEEFRTKQVVTKDSAGLEKEISVLLSCKNCPENKGGYICQKEYEDKCLAQKIQYIKELQQENAELKEELDAIDKAGKHVRQQINDAFRNKKPYWELEKENARIKEKCNSLQELVTYYQTNFCQEGRK